MRSPCALFAVSIAFCLFVPTVRPQSAPVPRLTLRVSDTVPVQGALSLPFQEQLHCDSSGDIYVRFYQVMNPLQAPVTRISSDGEHQTAFSLAAAPALHGAYIDSFAVAPDGTVVLLAWGQNPKTKLGEGYIVKLESDGTLDSTISLGDKDPFQIAVFPSGRLLVSGTGDERVYGADKPPVPVPFTAVLDDSGKIIKALTLPGDVEPPKENDPKFEEKIGRMPEEITLGAAEPGDDGNIYLLRHSGKPTVYVIAPDGTVVRTLHLTPPVPTASEGAIMQYSSAGGGRLAIPFTVSEPQGTTMQMISVYNAETGERFADYIAPPRMGGALACYTQQAFTFIGTTEQHQLVLRRSAAY